MADCNSKLEIQQKKKAKTNIGNQNKLNIMPATATYLCT